MGTIGFFQIRASVFAKFMPTQSAGSSPGPTVTAIASILGGLIVGINFRNCSKSSGSLSKIEFRIWMLKVEMVDLDSFKKLDSSRTFFKIGIKFFECSRFARVGNTPPYFLWILICERSAFPKILNSTAAPFGVAVETSFVSIILIAVSSQLVSMLSIFIVGVAGIEPAAFTMSM